MKTLYTLTGTTNLIVNFLIGSIICFLAFCLVYFFLNLDLTILNRAF